MSGYVHFTANSDMRYIFILLLLSASLYSFADEKNDSVLINFRQGSHRLDLNLSGNRSKLDKIVNTIEERKNDSLFMLRSVVVTGGCSPEGSVRLNNALSRRRANTLFDYIERYVDLPDSVMQFKFLGRDWRGLARLVDADPDVPFHDETVDLINRIADETDAGVPVKVDPLRRLQRFKNGAPYRYMYRRLFPALRASRMSLTYESRPVPGDKPRPYIEFTEPIEIEPEEPADTVVVEEEVEKPCRPFYMALKTNMLYDAALIPNGGIEFYLGKNISVTANWMYAWWKCDHKHNYWRVYGGDIEGRYWFGSAAHAKPLTGHHAGVYAQMLTYDFELGHRGYLAPRWSYGAGVSYGYSLPVAERINIDFTIGLGYFGGTYKEYLPIDDHYVWQATKRLHWFGPTKAEVSFVWLIGCDNKNR